MSVIKADEVYSPQNYCEEFLGVCPLFYGDQYELRDFLDRTGHNDLEDFRIDEIETVVDRRFPVVLVDTTYISDKCEMAHEFRWFMVPMVFKSIERCSDKQMLYDALSLKAMKVIDSILEAHFDGLIDVKEPRLANGDPDFEGEFELVIDDPDYVCCGCELLILKWVNDYEDTGYMIECMNCI